MLGAGSIFHLGFEPWVFLFLFICKHLHILYHGWSIGPSVRSPFKKRAPSCSPFLCHSPLVCHCIACHHWFGFCVDGKALELWTVVGSSGASFCFLVGSQLSGMSHTSLTSLARLLVILCSLLLIPLSVHSFALDSAFLLLDHLRMVPSSFYPEGDLPRGVE